MRLPRPDNIHVEKGNGRESFRWGAHSFITLFNRHSLCLSSVPAPRRGQCWPHSYDQDSPALDSDHPEWAGLGWGTLITVINNAVANLYWALTVCQAVFFNSFYLHSDLCGNGCCHAHFPVEKREAQRLEVTCPGSHSWWDLNVGSMLLTSNVQLLGVICASLPLTFFTIIVLLEGYFISVRS